jgi:proline dehydrogenase
MEDSYKKALEAISAKHDISIEHLERRVASRREKTFGLVSHRMAVRSLAFSMGIEPFLAGGARHVSGLKLTDALAKAQKETEAGNMMTLAFWPHPHDMPEGIAAQYLEAVEAIAKANLDSSISIKVDRLDYDRQKLMSVVREAKQHEVCIHFDAQSYESTDRTHALMEEALAMGADVSATLPSRWERSIKDAERLIELGVPFRVVKGQGGDPNNPRINPRSSFIDLVKQVAGRATHVGIATHDRRTAEPALEILIEAGTSCSLEQLRSLPRLDFLAKRRAIKVRAYIAYGCFGLPYSIREIIRRPAIAGWILRDAIVRLF